MADCFFRHGVELPRDIAGLLLAGVVSDTLNLTSPTTTVRDGEVLKKLEQLSQVNARQFTEEKKIALADYVIKNDETE